MYHAPTSRNSNSLKLKLIHGKRMEEEKSILLKLNSSPEPLCLALSNRISRAESELGQSTLSPIMASMSVGDTVVILSLSSPPLPAGIKRLLPFIESFFVLCEKLQSSNTFVQESVDASSLAPEKLRW
ncbi:E3 ubiquitin-protein ligase UPL1-like [Spinacia oleracea]|uniref:E3 ubiquitin-protein ligase UPL1-like n=1 Tax=Spinacia oleracea TaxID=3562 RepID=A0ABM3RLZ2_SPIOL|nr:E3 ubiquitin-protein ligase UPL1-like [Spinacia oleracea]XP_056696636.1 E3 ubiquitin-protein ligase UPL1-like [Spinacia oleracea]XP_056696637.1 E3 ubiquitin-protein ligase UPL1-like [Spinacia oleracea]